MKKSNLLAMASMLAVILFSFYAVAAPPKPPNNPLLIDISGYEVALGFPCTTGTTQKCGVVFFGWTGGVGPFPLNSNPTQAGWVPSPGTSEGSWSSNLDYEGTPGYGNTVALLGGYFNLELTNRTAVSGVVTSGTVQWPASESTYVSSPLCGPGVATISLQLSIRGPAPGEGSFTGCLLDQYPNVYGYTFSATNPPPIWGTLVARIEPREPRP